MKDQASRWRAFAQLARVDAPGGPPRHALEDPATGLRYVRAEWFGEFVAEKTGPGIADAVVRAMPPLGWTKPGREGRVKATQPGGRQTLQWAFFVIPVAWEDR
ncbi:hypothetical protein [Capillimicrobium parvum]|uniref:Uncharacterized protein n=1 Tax=Capillimicrobium parvum TaxID=2884022 RepID=A0A9E6XTE1_9ACTN|nr:hypothetical protein [Capillimicrobium parvum]UGS34248.1 hypothetical protein DSM104329_00624 [Capillimicrobium parvum]